MISCFVSDDLRRTALEDVVLEALQLERGLAQHRERRIDAGVDDLVEQVAGPLGEDLLAQVVLLAIPLEHRRQRWQRHVRQRDDVIGTHEQVELGSQDARAVLVEEWEVQHDEDVVVVLVELRALVAREDVLVVERVEIEVLLQPVAVRGAGRFDVDPADGGRLDDLRIRHHLGHDDVRLGAGTTARARQRTRERQVGHGGMVRHGVW